MKMKHQIKENEEYLFFREKCSGIRGDIKRFPCVGPEGAGDPDPQIKHTLYMFSLKLAIRPPPLEKVGPHSFS